MSSVEVQQFEWEPLVTSFCYRLDGHNNLIKLVCIYEKLE